MAKQIVVTLGGKTSSFDFKKVTRAQLSGKTSRRVLDPDGEVCARGSVTRDGSLLLRSGMVTNGYFLQGSGKWVPNAELIGLDRARRPVEKVPSTLGEPQELEGPVAVEELLDLSLAVVYALTGTEVDSALKKSLDQGEIYRMLFNYRADYEGQTAHLLAGKADGLPYLLVGSPAGAAWVQKQQVVEETFEDDAVEVDDDEDMMDF